MGTINARVFYQCNCTDFLFSFISSLVLSPTLLLSISGLQTRIDLNIKIGLISLNLFSFELTHLFEMPMQSLLRERKLIVKRKKKSFPFNILFLLFHIGRANVAYKYLFLLFGWIQSEECLTFNGKFSQGIPEVKAETHLRMIEKFI